MSTSILLLALLICTGAVLAALVLSLRGIASQQALLLQALQTAEHEWQRSVLNLGTQLGERNQQALFEHSERLRSHLNSELTQLRETIHQLQLNSSHELAKTREDTQTALHLIAQTQREELAQTRELLLTQLNTLTTNSKQAQTEFLGQTLQTLAEQGRAQQTILQTTLQQVSEQLNTAVNGLNTTVKASLDEISGKVTERLDEGFKKTNETFVNVMVRLATIDEAQKKIDSLTSNVVTLQTLLGDKRSRGAFGEVQLESLVRNVLPADACEFQVSLSNGTRVDCLLKLPQPTGNVAIDAKFPLENYHRMISPDLSDSERAAANRNFKADIRKHIDDIASKYIIDNETSDGAVMFVPAEAVFAEIHGNHPELNEYAQQHRVWIVSPTTLMAVLNTARAVIKDVETRRQVHIIKEELSRLGKEFNRFDTRMKKLADHIRQAHEDAAEVHTTSQKISRRFSQIEAVDLEHLRETAPLLPEDPT